MTFFDKKKRSLLTFGGAIALAGSSGIITSVSNAEVVVTGNPHYHKDQCPKEMTQGAGDFGCVSSAELVPSNVITSLQSNLQADTIRSVVPVKMRDGFHSYRAPVYHFVQSPRLVEKQLPFKLLLLREILSPSVVAVPVDHSSGADSWFVGYKWSLLLCINPHDGSVKHLGWKFTSPTGDYLHAVIVEHADPEETMTVRQKQGLAAGVRITNMLGEEQDVFTAENKLHPDESELEIAPRRAETWMIMALTSYRAWAAKSAGGGMN